MADVVNKTDFTVLRSVNTAEYPTTSWVINSGNLNTLVGNGTDTNPQIPKIYWIVDPPTSQNLREMTQLEKDVVDIDSPSLSLIKEEKKALLYSETESFVFSRYSRETQQTFSNLIITAVGNDREQLNSYYNWYNQEVYAAHVAAINAVDDAANIPDVEAVTIDYATLASLDPNVTLGDGEIQVTVSDTIEAPYPHIKYYVESESVSSTTSSSPQTKLQINTITNIPAANYKVEWDFTWYRTSVVGDCHFGILIDGYSIWDIEVETKDPSINQRIPVSGSKEIALTNDVHTIDLVYNNINSNGFVTVGISQAHMTMRWTL